MPRCALVIVGCLLAGCLGPSRRWETTEVTPITASAAPPRATPTVELTPRELIGEADSHPREPLPEEIHAIALEGIKAYEFKLGVLADNLANAQTVGFKRRRVLIQESRERSVEITWDDEQQAAPPVRKSCGQGCHVINVIVDHAQGPLEQTDRNLDIAIEGRGFFQVIDPNSGDTHYTRVGHFDINVNGHLVFGIRKHAWLIEPAITIPPDATEIIIGTDGSVDYRSPGTETLTNAGQLQLASFTNVGGLKRLGDGLYAATDASGTPTPDVPGSNGLGKLRQDAVELSNVNPLDEQRRLEECRLMLRRLRRLLPPEMTDVE